MLTGCCILVCCGFVSFAGKVIHIHLAPLREAERKAKSTPLSPQQQQIAFETKWDPEILLADRLADLPICVDNAQVVFDFIQISFISIFDRLSYRS